MITTDAVDQFVAELASRPMRGPGSFEEGLRVALAPGGEEVAERLAMHLGFRVMTAPTRALHGEIERAAVFFSWTDREWTNFEWLLAD